MATTVYVAHHPYDAEKDDELTLEVGDLINVSDSSDPGWWVGERVKDGKAGWFPSNFVDPYEQPAAETSAPLSEPVADAPALATTAAAPAAPEEAAPAAPKHEGPVLARVEYDYEAKESGELSLEVGRVVTILDSSDPAWWTGDLNGKVGTFPSNYVKLLEHKEETEGSGDKPAKFKLAAFGVKQGGLGSLFAGGVVPGLKKTGLKKVGGVDTGAQAAGTSKRSSMDEPRSPVVHAAPPKVAPPVAEEVLAPLVNPTAVRAAPPPAPVVPVEQVASPEPRVPSRAKKPKVKQIKALVLYDYTAQEDDEISLVKGSTIVVTDKMGDEGWWSGRCDNGDAGNFPSDFVQEIKEDATQSPTVAPAAPTPTPAAAPAPAPIAIPTATTVADATLKSPVHSRPPIHAPVPLPSIPVEPIRTDLPRSRTDPPLATPPAFPRGSRPPSMIASPTQAPAQVHDARPLNEGPPLPGSPPPKRLSMVSRTSSHDHPASPRHTNAPAIPEPTSPMSTHSTHGDLSRSSTTSRRPHKPVPEAPLQEAEEEESHTPAVEDTAAASSEAPVTPNRNSYILPTPVSRNRPLPPLARPPSIHQVTENNRRSVVIPPSAHLPSVPSETEETAQESHVIQEEKDEPEADSHQQHEEAHHVASAETVLPETVEQKVVSEESAAQDEPAIAHQEEEAEEQAHEAEEAKVHQEDGVQGEAEATVVSANAEQEQQQQEQEQEEELVAAAVEEEKEPEKPKLPEIESSGPALSHASRPRPAKGRKPPSAPVPNAETSFVSQLEADVKAAPMVEEKKPETSSSVEKVAPPPPPKPIKPIFQKFPTPFAGAQPLNVTLRPTGRRAGSSNDAPQSPGGHGGESAPTGGVVGGAGPGAGAGATPATATVPPAGGVKSLSSRFGQFQGVPASGGNSAALELEIAKLRRWMTEELDRVKKELADERESRERLQEEVNQLKAQLQG
ncbi:SH3-domain kinase binding protein 1 [Mortierella alpina]|nr:SH3-domain kinase binding protein 1 [Mortierella alpina]